MLLRDTGCLEGENYSALIHQGTVTNQIIVPISKKLNIAGFSRYPAT